jgi:hypothetical protein
MWLVAVLLLLLFLMMIRIEKHTIQAFWWGDSWNLSSTQLEDAACWNCRRLYPVVLFGSTTATILLILPVLLTNDIILFSSELLLLLLLLSCLGSCQSNHLLPKLFCNCVSVLDTWTSVCVCMCACFSLSWSLCLNLSFCRSFCVSVLPDIFWWVSKQCPVVVLLALLWDVASSFALFFQWLAEGEGSLVVQQDTGFFIAARKNKKVEKLFPLRAIIYCHHQPCHTCIVVIASWSIVLTLCCDLHADILVLKIFPPSFYL